MTADIKLFTKRLVPPEITLFESRDSVPSFWDKHVGQRLPQVHIYHGGFGDLAYTADAIVVPVSSTGVIPSDYAGYFGNPALEQCLQTVIRNKHSGKLLLGRVVIIATEMEQFPYLICTPIVRADGVCGNEPTNAYVAMRGVLEFWRYGFHKHRVVRRLVKSIVIPILAPTPGLFSMDTVVKEQLKALQENLDAWSEVQRRFRHLSLVPDLKKP
jgi:hypothetical protein